MRANWYVWETLKTVIVPAIGVSFAARLYCEKWNSDIQLLSFQSVIFHKDKKCKNTPLGTTKTFQGFTCIAEKKK